MDDAWTDPAIWIFGFAGSFLMGIVCTLVYIVLNRRN